MLFCFAWCQPVTKLRSYVAVAASRLGSSAVARKSSGVMYRRYVESTEDGELYESHPMASQRLRRDVVVAASFPAMRAAAR